MQKTTITKPNLEFLTTLQEEAKLQKKLSRSEMLPNALQPFAAFVATYSWQSLAIISLVFALIITTLGIELHIL